MVNRVLEVKRFKLKRRRMKFQGKFSTDQIMGDRARERANPSHIHLSKQLINVGLRVPGMSLKGPLDKAGYQHENPIRRDLLSDLPETLSVRVKQVLSKEQNNDFHNTILQTKNMKVLCFFDLQMKDIYLVRIRFSQCTVEKSINYRTIAAAQEAALLGKVVWLQLNP